MSNEQIGFYHFGHLEFRVLHKVRSTDTAMHRIEAPEDNPKRGILFSLGFAN